MCIISRRKAFSSRLRICLKFSCARGTIYHHMMLECWNMCGCGIGISGSACYPLAWPSSLVHVHDFDMTFLSSTSTPVVIDSVILCIYRSASSSSGSGCWAASFISFWYSSISCWLTETSGGASAGAATNSSCGLPTSFRASHRKGFSKL